jgi:hypothetical protein
VGKKVALTIDSERLAKTLAAGGERASKIFGFWPGLCGAVRCGE